MEPHFSHPKPQPTTPHIFLKYTFLADLKRPTFTIGPEKTINGSSVYTIQMELREGDLAKNQNIRSSRGAAQYSLTLLLGG